MAEIRRLLYLDCFSGISGDMFLGALLDIGASETAVRQGLAQLPIGQEFNLGVEKTQRQGIRGTSLTVKLVGQAHDYGNSQEQAHGHDGHQDQVHDHTKDHSHEQEHVYHGETAGRHYLEICQMIDQSSLKPAVRQTALQIFRTIGEAEAAVHGVALDDVHFHEVGAVDSIVDIVGSALALDSLNVDQVICSTISDGSGLIRCRHGLLPVPVPAVVKMLEGTDIPYRTGTSETELVTPTGLGLVKSLCTQFGSLPVMQIRKTGYGFGQRDIGRLNALRVFLGETAPAVDVDLDQDDVLLLSCNLDNSTPEQLGYAAGRLMQAGALDVSFQPLMMKKWRPGQLMLVVAAPELEYELVGLIFELTGTIGIRRQSVRRHTMQREIRTVQTSLGPVRMKTCRWRQIVKTYPEQADLIQAAEKAGISPAEAEKRIGSELARGQE